LKPGLLSLYLAYRNLRMPWATRKWAAAVVAYTFSPIDLLPNFIPILSYLDDLVLIPLGIWLARMMIPLEVLADAHENAHHALPPGKALNWVITAMFIIMWILASAGATFLIQRLAARFRL